MTLKSLLTSVAAGALGLALATSASAETFKMQTFLGANAATTKAFEAMAAKLKADTNGEVDIQVFPSGAVVGPRDTVDAIEGNLLDGQYSAPTFFAGKDPAMGVLGDTLSAYPDTETRDTWFSKGGGLELARDLYGKYGLHVICIVHWPREQIPSTVPIRSVDDFKGIKIRAPGALPSDLLTRAGASLVNLTPGDAVTAFETGVLDASDLASVGLNVAFGMHNRAKYSILARHSMPVTEMSVRKDKWDGLSADAQAKFAAACQNMSDELKVTLTAQDEAAIAKAKNELGVEFIEFGAEDQAKFRSMLLDVWADWGAKSADSQAIVDSHKAYMKSLDLL